MRARDALGRPVPASSPDAVAPVHSDDLSPQQALTHAQELLDQGRAFFAHEVLEATWKTCPDGDREYWQGLAQLCVGITHLQRGNVDGAVTLLQRGAGHLTGRLCAWGHDAADRIAAGDLTLPRLTLAD